MFEVVLGRFVKGRFIDGRLVDRTFGQKDISSTMSVDQKAVIETSFRPNVCQRKVHRPNVLRRNVLSGFEVVLANLEYCVHEQFKCQCCGGEKLSPISFKDVALPFF